MNLSHRLISLSNNLSSMDSKSPVEWQIGQMFNALLEEAKQQVGDDPVVKTMEPLKPSSNRNFVAGLHVGTLNTMVDQLDTALPSEGPGTRLT
jgi:hypothetical protein